MTQKIRQIFEQKLEDQFVGMEILDKVYWEKFVPEEYREFGNVFSKLTSERMPKGNSMIMPLSS